MAKQICNYVGGFNCSLGYNDRLLKEFTINNYTESYIVIFRFGLRRNMGVMTCEQCSVIS